MKSEWNKYLRWRKLHNHWTSKYLTSRKGTIRMNQPQVGEVYQIYNGGLYRVSHVGIMGVTIVPCQFKGNLASVITDWDSWRQTMGAILHTQISTKPGAQR